MRWITVTALSAVPLILAGCGSSPPGQCQPGASGYEACWAAWSAERQRKQSEWPWVLEIRNKE